MSTISPSVDVCSNPWSGEAFLRFSLERNVLRFGQFTTKAGRNSPYFFNAGLFNTGEDMARLGQFYASAAVAAGVPFDMLFGPAYKGIPLVTAVAMALATDHQRNLPLAFNRKEAKDHGEGGTTIGAPLHGRVLIVDDVISAGTSVRESVQIILAAGATPAGVLIALDRQERGLADLSATQEVQQMFGIPVIAIATLERLMHLLATDPSYARAAAGNTTLSPEAINAAIGDYRRQYGVS
jgi:orotate phosphoribosyltransferase